MIDSERGATKNNDKSISPVSYHVIGEDCSNPGTYRSQLGTGEPRVNGITDPMKAGLEYYKKLKDGKDTKLLPVHMCCSCKKQS